MPKKKQTPEDMRTLWIVLAIVSVMMLIFMWATSIAAQIFVPEWEERLFLAVYGWPQFLLPLFLVITQLGSVWFLIAVTLVAWAKGNKRLSLFAALAGSLVYATVWAGKEIIMRPRPDNILPHVEAHEPATGGFGYPSGHTALITVLVFLLWTHVPKRYRWILVALVGFVAISRLYLGMHFPLDVAGGFLIGGMFGILLYLPHNKKVGKPKWLYRNVRI